MNEQNSNQNNMEEFEMLDIIVLDSVYSTSAIQQTTDNTPINNGLERIKVENDLRIIKRRRQLYLELVPPVYISVSFLLVVVGIA
jgi:hypothetical protein